MGVSLILSSQVNLERVNDCVLFSYFGRNLNVNLFRRQTLTWPSRSDCGFSIRASASAHNQALVSEKASKVARTNPIDDMKLYVGLPLDVVSNSNSINHARAIAVGLKALKLLGVDGVELPLWWGIAEDKSMGKYDWTGYLAIAEMVQKLGLKLHVSLSFHASHESKISLPQWVSQIGVSDPSIYFTDRSGMMYKDCVSLSVDDIPVFYGKTPLEVYRDFFENFKSAFSPFFGSTITGLSVGLGPDGELCYPSHHRCLKRNVSPGVGEFQCYDKYMLSDLKHHAESHGNPLWGLGGPHDAPSYDQSPLTEGGFFAEKGGSWETPYGHFFLSWYSKHLTRHGDQMLSLAASTFKDLPITLSGKIPLLHPYSKSRSHGSELTAGFYNTANRDGYEAIAEIFARNRCKIILPGMDLSDDDLPIGTCSSPESLLARITGSCGKHGVKVSGQNISSGSFEQIKKKFGENGVVDLFTYQRVGAHLFSPEQFPSFAQFVRRIKQLYQSFDESAVEGEYNAEFLSGNNVQVKAV